MVVEKPSFALTGRLGDQCEIKLALGDNRYCETIAFMDSDAVGANPEPRAINWRRILPCPGK